VYSKRTYFTGLWQWKAYTGIGGSVEPRLSSASEPTHVADKTWHGSE